MMDRYDPSFSVCDKARVVNREHCGGCTGVHCALLPLGCVCEILHDEMSGKGGTEEHEWNYLGS